MAKQRLDTLLAERGLFESRSRAAASVMAGDVLLGEQERQAQKPGEMVASDVLIRVRAQPRYVSRGGIKLDNALLRTEIDVAGRVALDVGASTGGFTDCLLQRGAAEVIAVDVGYGELAHRLRTDPRVHVLERTNARALAPAMLPAVPNLAVVDVSFISLTKVLPAVLACLAAPYDVLALVKPQFEAPRASVGKGGVVRDAAARLAALVAVGRAAVAIDSPSGPPAVLGFRSSGLPGPKGNRETFIWLAPPGPAGGVRGAEEIERMALVEERPA
ncbi:MAG TPA: TlyA family RNA methyltransferase [Solirubrobacteraceae bacterium]|jgi:23S rRNA (cytidine1920-2'-O)/16S rRNA (cytidine1409-2'-O)-methyltransferase|nr:TlyA family RNA methyltransferase [Solirubrobacteraceae bacterium]